VTSRSTIPRSIAGVLARRSSRAEQREPPNLPAPELVEGRIEGSVNIPMNELPARLSELPQDREIVAVCKKGMRSFNVAGWLRQMGRSAVSLQGGIDQWKALGLPVTR